MYILIVGRTISVTLILIFKEQLSLIKEMLTKCNLPKPPDVMSRPWILFSKTDPGSFLKSKGSDWKSFRTIKGRVPPRILFWNPILFSNGDKIKILSLFSEDSISNRQRRAEICAVFFLSALKIASSSWKYNQVWNLNSNWCKIQILEK